MNKSPFALEGSELIASALHAQLLNRRRGTFEHDLKNVMHGLMSGTELLDKSIRSSSARIAPAECLKLLQQQLARAQATLNRMIDEISPTEIVVSDIDFNELMEECSHDLRHQLQRLELELDVEANLIVHAERRHLKDLLLFILFEAIDRAPPRSHIELHAARGDDGHAHVRVRHELCGPNDSQNFDAVASMLSGEDIGLEVNVAGNERRIDVAIPLAKAAASAEAKQRLLIVDANRDAADSLAMLVELEGFAASVAYDAASALQAVQAAAPTAVLIDADGSIDIETLARSLREHVPAATVLIGLRHTLESSSPLLQAQLRKPLDLAALQELLRGR